MFIFYNPNPTKLLVGDCVIRGLSKILNKDWETVFTELCVEALVMHNLPSANNVWERFIMNRGFKRNLVPDTCPDCYTVKDFCIDHPIGLFLLATGEHVVAVEDGNYYDTWDSGDEHPLYYWSDER